MYILNLYHSVQNLMNFQKVSCSQTLQSLESDGETLNEDCNRAQKMQRNKKIAGSIW